MPELITELVNAAVDTSVSSVELLRRALVVARRLEVPELVEWIDCELKGYLSGEVPSYRRVWGRLVAENTPYAPVPYNDQATDVRQLADFSIRQSIPELIKLAQSENGIFYHFPAEIEQILVERIRQCSGEIMRPALMFSTAQIQGVIESMRSRLLELALDLEAKGVVGQDMRFSQTEKQIVHEQHYHFGDVSGSQIQIGSNGSNQTLESGDMEALTSLIQLLQIAMQQGTISNETRDELQAELTILQAQAESPKPKWPIIKATVGCIKAVLANAAGNVVAAPAMPFITALLR